MAHNIQREIAKLESSIAEYSKANLYFSNECEELRLKVRDLYVEILFVDYEFALQNDIEQSLWKTSFYKVIEEHRKKLRHCYHASKNGNQSALAELSKECQIFRKLLNSYSSFYLSLINKLEEHYQLKPVKSLMKGDELEGIDTTNTHKSISSCFRCLIYLGDLTRYHRDLYYDPHQKDWKNASNYYRKAFFLQPTHGNPHNQLAVLSTYSDDDIETVYRYYRSLVIRYPFLTAAENLVVLFDKNTSKYTSYRRELQSPPKNRNLSNRPNTEIYKSFVLSFVRLHGMIYSPKSIGNDYSQFFEVKMQVIKDLTVLLNRDLLSEEVLLKLVVINISSINLDSIATQRSSSQYSPATKEFKKISFLYSVEFASTIILKAHKSQNNSKYLGSIITYLEWFLTQDDISQGLQKKEKRIWISFWKHLAQLLTHIHSSRYVTSELTSLIDSRDGLPLLPEEIELKGFLPLDQAHQSLPLTSSYDNLPGNFSVQENFRALRISKLLSISKSICKKFPILYYSDKDAKFIVSRAEPHSKSPILSPILQQRPSYILSPAHMNSTSPVNNGESYHKNNHQDNEKHENVFTPDNSPFNHRLHNGHHSVNDTPQNGHNVSHSIDSSTENYVDELNQDELVLNRDLETNEDDDEDNERRAQIEEEIASYAINDYDVDDEIVDEIILFKPRNVVENDSPTFRRPEEENFGNQPNNNNNTDQYFNFATNPHTSPKNGEFNLFYSGLSIDNYNIFNFLQTSAAEDEKAKNNVEHYSFFDSAPNQSFFANNSNGNFNNSNNNGNSDSLWGYNASYSFFSNNSPQSAWLSTESNSDQSLPENTPVTVIENPFPQLFQANNVKSPYKDWP